VDRVHERFVELVVTESVTVAANPFSGEMVIVAVPGELVVTLTLVALVVIVKSWAW
jgi:hypothetical protein